MFRTKVRELREQAGYTSQKSFADAFGVAQTTVASWEGGKREPGYETTIRLADFFHVSVDYLLGREDTKKEQPPAQGGEPLDPVTRELLEIVDTSTPAEREMMMDMIRVIKKQRRE